MAETKMISYQRWRNKLAKKGFFEYELVNYEAFRRLSKHADTLVLEPKETDRFEEMTPEMFFFKKDKKKKVENQLVQELKEMCQQQQQIFRKSRVDKLKRQIQNNEYNIPGNEVVEKWFPEESE